jgi:hypothetical protein
MNNTIYIYTEEEIRDFYFNDKGCEIFISIVNIYKINNLLNQKITLNIVIDFFEYTDNILFIQDICFWINIYFVCNYNKWLFENISENKQWIFNTPEHPFEIYLNKKNNANILL